MKFNKKKLIYALLFSVPFIIGLSLMLYLNISEQKAIHLWDCPVYVFWGLECPGCGVTRALCAILTFRFLDAIKYNAVMFVMFFIIAVYYTRFFYVYVRYSRFISLKAKYLYIILAVIVVFTLVRNMPFYPFDLDSL